MAGVTSEDLAWHRAGLRMARADLGYVSALIGQPALAALSVFPYAVLVAYEADHSLTRWFGAESVLQATPMAVAARMAGKVFDDKLASLAEIAAELRELSAANERLFRGGGWRSIARSMGIFNPDLSVFMLDGRPLLHSGVLPFQLGVHALGSDELQRLGPLVRSLAEQVGTLAAVLGVTGDGHRGGLDPAARIEALDAVASDYAAVAFGGQATPTDVLLLSLLQNNLAVGARLAHSNCCESCESAAVKHKFLSAYHSARSLQLATSSESDLLSAPLRARLTAITASQGARFLLRHRPLRNSLVHLGLSDRPSQIVEATDPIRGLIEQDLDAPWSEASATIRDAAAGLDDRLMTCLLADRAELLGCLRVPQ